MAHLFSPEQQAELNAFFLARLAEQAEAQRVALRTELETEVGARFEEHRNPNP